MFRSGKPRSARKQTGSTLMIAVFIILVISLLGSSLVSLQRDSAEGTSYEVYAARAYLAAYSATEIALAQLFPLDPETESSCAAVTAEPTLPGDTAGFYGCTVNVSCTLTAAAAGIATRYKVSATAVCKNSQIITRRQVTVEAANL